MRVRFAPSPTGNLHIGSVRTALFNWFFASHHNATLVLRIEDTDEQRSSSDFEQNIIDGLEWLGIPFDESPDNPGPYGPYRQSERIAANCYESHLNQLQNSGHIYRCFCTAEELDAERSRAKTNKKPYVYSRTCLRLSDDEIAKKIAQSAPFTYRFKVPHESLVFHDLIRGPVEFDLSLLSDFILTKPNGQPNYNFAVVADDIDMKITHVLRGEDHISNTPKQLLLFKALTKTVPEFGHLPIILGEDRSKLSKRHGATAVIDYQKQGFLPAALINYLALLGWSPNSEVERLSANDICKQFTLNRVNKSGAIFDMAKLTWMNGQYIRDLSTDDLMSHIEPFLNPAARQLLTESPHNSAIIELVHDSLDTLADINECLSIFLLNTIDIPKQSWSPEQRIILTQFRDHLKASNSSEPNNLKSLLMTIKTDLSLTVGMVFKTVRLAISGQPSGPDLMTYLSIHYDVLIERLTHQLA